VRQRDLEFSELIARKYPLLTAALRHVGHRQTRNRGTVGGSLAHADPSAELPNVCAAMDAVIHIEGPRGARQTPFAEFNLAFMTTAVEPDELLAAVEISPWAESHGYSFQEFARRHGDFAVVGVAALLEIDAGKIVRASLSACGVSTGPMRLRDVEARLVGEDAGDGTIERASALAREIDAIGDHHASADYRRHLAAVLCQRALSEARGRCRPGLRGAAQ
jgi:carbon-monoxide dehydrogenase medium subunit